MIPLSKNEKKDRRQDGHRWTNGGVSTLPKKFPNIKKTNLDIADEVVEKIQGNKSFTKYAYKLVKEDLPILIPYIGDSELSQLTAHRNTREKSKYFNMFNPNQKKCYKSS